MFSQFTHQASTPKTASVVSELSTDDSGLHSGLEHLIRKPVGGASLNNLPENELSFQVTADAGNLRYPYGPYKLILLLNSDTSITGLPDR